MSGRELRPPDEVIGYYELGGERARLEEGYFPLERARTQELVMRHLRPPPGIVLDVGGACGAYAFWLAELGYAVHLVDPVPIYVEQAQAASRSRAAGCLASAQVGDARRLRFSSESAEAVLLLGPLYHLTDRHDRVAALSEACRVLRHGGVVLAAGISRFASLFEGLRGPVFDHEVFARIVERDLADGQHRNETGHPGFFTTAFFHQPDELADELRESGLTLSGLFAVEGPGAFLPDFTRRWSTAKDRERLLDLVRRVEREPALLGVSPHLLAVGNRP